MVVEPGPAYSVQDVYNGWCSGLAQAGVEVVPYNHGAALSMYQRAMFEEPRLGGWFNPWSFDQIVLLASDMLLAHAVKTRPDAVILVFGKFVPHHTIRALQSLGIKVVYHFTESPYEDDMQVNHSVWADLCLINDPQNLERFPAGTLYQPHCFDPAIHHPHGRAEKWDFTFTGTGYDSRVEFLEAVDFGDLTVRLEGNWPTVTDDSPIRKFLGVNPEECIDNADAADLYRASAMSANIYRKESNRPDLSDGVAVGPREVELAACGTFFLREPRPEGDELFPMLPTFTTPDEFSELLQWWHAHPGAREEAAQQALSVIADRTFEQAARRLIRTLERLS